MKQERRRYAITLAFLATLFVSSFAVRAYGHGLGEDQAVPVSAGDRQLTVSAKINPASIPIDPSIPPSLLIRAYDQNSNETIGRVDYTLQVELGNETLLEQRFSSSDGIILANLSPDNDIDKWQIAGHESAASDEQIEVSQASPVEIKSRILAAGGLYHLGVTIEKSSQGIALQDDVKFDLYISVAHSQHFAEETPADGERDFVVKTYYDDVEDFSYNNGTISFSMPFDWRLGYINQVSVLHMEVQFPKSVEGLKTNSYIGSLNGVTLPASSIQIDDYTSEQDRIVHFIVPGNSLSDIAEEITPGTDSAVFSLSGSGKPKFPMDLLSSPGEKYLLQLSWGPDVIETGVPITFVMNIRDPTTDEVLRRPYFDFVISQGGTEIYRERLQSDLGTFAKDYTFSQPGTATFAASNINGDGESIKLDLVVLQGSSNPPPQQSPSSPSTPSGCLIATAAYGSELSPQVQYLRNFREQYILSTAAGSAFMNTFNAIYYSFSPQVADYERGQPWLQSMVKAGLYPLFGILMASERAHFGVGGGEWGAVLAGAVASSLIGATYLLPAGVAFASRIKTSWILVSMAMAGIFLLASAIALPQSLLPLSTASFVAVLAGSAALLAGKPLAFALRRLRNR